MTTTHPRPLSRLLEVAKAIPREPLIGITMEEARNLMFERDLVPVNENAAPTPRDTSPTCRLMGLPCIILDLPPGFRLKEMDE